MAGVALEQGDFVQPCALVPLENIVQDNCSWDLVKQYSNVDCLLLAIELMPKDGAYWYNGFYWHLLGYRLGENAKTTGKEQDQRVQIPKSLLQNGKGCPHQEISRARSRVHSSGSSPLQPDQVDERVCYLVAHQLGERELLKSVGHDIPVASKQHEREAAREGGPVLRGSLRPSLGCLWQGQVRCFKYFYGCHTLVHVTMLMWNGGVRR